MSIIIGNSLSDNNTTKANYRDYLEEMKLDNGGYDSAQVSALIWPQIKFNSRYLAKKIKSRLISLL
jgi:hypothetical protein